MHTHYTHIYSHTYCTCTQTTHCTHTHTIYMLHLTYFSHLIDYGLQLFTICCTDSSQSAARVATTPTTDHCTMKVMRRTVANKLATYWQVVCQHLGYTPQQFRRENDKKSLIAVLECWVAAGEREGRPKTWPQFISVITDINSSISGEICDSLRTKGVWTGELLHYSEQLASGIVNVIRFACPYIIITILYIFLLP